MIPVDPRPRPIPRRERAGGKVADLPDTRFGRFRAAKSLEDILDELGSRSLSRAMARHHADFLHGLNQLEHVPSPRFRKWFMERFALMYREHLLATFVNRTEGRERDAWTHLACVIAAHARERIRGINAEIHEAWLDMTRERRAAASRRDRLAARRARGEAP